MTAISLPLRRAWWRSRQRVLAVDVPSLSARALLARSVLVTLLLAALTLALQLTAISGLQQRAAQQRLFDSFRASLAQGTAPVGPVDLEGRALAPGSPVALVEIPALGLRQVVVEGTSGTNLFAGPGHRRDSPLPGQAGVSIIMGRQATFGGPFARLDELEAGDLIRATTGQGAFEFRVEGVRREGDPLPAPPGPGDGRLLLATAGGRPLVPNAVLRVDAGLEDEAQPGPPPLFSSSNLPVSEQMMASDSTGLWRLAGWLQAALAVGVAAVWAWHRWGRAQAWIAFFPAFLFVGVHVSNNTAELLPNLL